jgi:MFS family permease
MGRAGLPTGFLLARASRRAVALVGLVLFSAATALTAVATGFWDLLVYRFVSGVGETMQLAAPLAIGTAYFKQAALAVSMYGLGALLSLFGGWLGDRFDFRILLAVSLGLSAICGYALFSGVVSLAAHVILSFVFGGAISGMVYANLSAGVITSVKSQIVGQGSGLFVASLYIPAAFAGYLLGALAVHLGWSAAALIQLSGFSVLAAILALFAWRRTTTS